MSDEEKMIDDIEQALAQQEQNLRAEAEARKVLTGEADPTPVTVSEPEPDFEDDFMEIDPWDNVYKPRARERRKRRRGEDVSLPFDESAPRPRQPVIEHREKREEKRLQRTREKEKSRKKAQEAAAEAVDDLSLWGSESSDPSRELTRREKRRKRIIEEEMAQGDPYGREWLTPDETRAIEHRDALRRKKSGRREKKRRRPGRIVLLVILIIIAALVASGFGMYYLGKKNLTESNLSTVEQTAPEGAGASDGVISYDGKTYHYNDNLINVLVFGVATEENEDSSERLAATGIFLWSYDTEKKSTNLITMPGHLLTECPVFDDNNEFVYMNEQQLGASYASGGTTELRRYQNVTNSVSNLFYGLPVNAYLVVDMSKISEMNDAIGGVSLRVLEDLTVYDEQLIEGEQVTLTGDQATAYVNGRSTAAESELEAETGLLRRQVQYMQGYISRAKTAIISVTNAKELLELLREDTYSDMELPEFIYMFVTLMTDDLNSTETAVPIDEEAAASAQEIRADQTALFEQMLTLFYQE